MLFRNRLLSIRGGDLLDVIGLVKLTVFLVTTRSSGCAVPDAAASALATTRCSDFHAILPHALQQQIDGSDGSCQQGDGDKRNKHDIRSNKVWRTGTISYRTIRVVCSRLRAPWFGQASPLEIDPGSSQSAWSSMRAGNFFKQGLQEILVNAIISRLVESIDKKWICLTRVPGCAASRPRNSANLLSTLNWAAQMHGLLLLAVLAVLGTETIAADARTVREGDRVMLKGTFSIEKGNDNQERTVRYQAMKLNDPIEIEFEGGREENVQRLKLWLQAMPPDTFSKFRGKQLIVSGRIHHFAMGPSTFPNPTKLEVFSVKQVSPNVRPNPSLQGTL